AAAARGRARNHVWLVTPALQTDLGLDGVIAAARAAGVPMLGLRQTAMERAEVDAVRAAGLGIGGWACNDAASIARMVALGVDVFTTDRPDLALAERARLSAGGRS